LFNKVKYFYKKDSKDLNRGENKSIFRKEKSDRMWLADIYIARIDVCKH